MLLTNVNITWRLTRPFRFACDAELRDRAIEVYVLPLEGERLRAAQAEGTCEEYDEVDASARRGEQPIQPKLPLPYR